MIRIRLSRGRGFALALALLATTAIPAMAQSGGGPNPTADRLSEQVRILADNPRNLEALISAGQLSAKLGDTAAALAFLARAEAVDPNDARIFAARGSALVQMEKPGEALRMFNEAERRGLAADRYAADRGFAYDLLGAPELAQRDYRVALQHGNDDEIVRRFALSLGISGRGDEAMTLLDPLLRRSDRPSWRARAFILAMTGDVAGAEKIASTMMPGNMGAALSPFFRKLPTLGNAERAFAVHFGELAPTAARLADARNAPALPAYTPTRPVVLAAVTPTPTPTPAPAAAQPIGPRSAPDRRSRRQRDEDERLALAAARVQPVPVPTPPPPPAPPTLEPPRYQPPTVQSLPNASQPTYSAQLAQNGARPAAVLPAETDVRVREPGAIATPATNLRPAAQPQAPRQLPAPTPTAQPQVQRQAPAPAPATKAGRERFLAQIVAGIDVPDSERAITTLPATSAARPTKAELARIAKADAEDARADRKGRNDKADSRKKKPKEPAEPARIWVQVAGGANQKALPGAWDKVVKQSPAAFKGRAAYTAPLRATNRLLTGPFDSDEEAQEFVNKLRKEGISSFQFNSNAGQKIARIGGARSARNDDEDQDEPAKGKKSAAKKSAGKNSAARERSVKKETRSRKGRARR